jgi:hypothetical protein
MQKHGYKSAEKMMQIFKNSAAKVQKNVCKSAETVLQKCIKIVSNLQEKCLKRAEKCCKSKGILKNCKKSVAKLQKHCCKIARLSKHLRVHKFGNGVSVTVIALGPLASIVILQYLLITNRWALKNATINKYFANYFLLLISDEIVLS